MNHAELRSFDHPDQVRTSPHFQYHVSGTLRVAMEGGREVNGQAGEVAPSPAGHDAWVVGDELDHAQRLTK